MTRLLAAVLLCGAVLLVVAAPASATVRKVSFTGVVSPNDYAELAVRARLGRGARSR